MKLELRTNPLNEVREQGLVPGVLYGNNFETQNIQVNLKDLSKQINEKGFTLSFDVNLNNEKHIVFFKEVQRDPLQPQKILHFDLQKVSAKDTIVAAIPVNLVGREEVEGKGLIVQLLADAIDCEYSVTEGISSIDVDVSNLEAGESIHAADIQLPEGIELRVDDETVIVNVSQPTVLEDGSEDEDAGQAEEPADE